MEKFPEYHEESAKSHLVTRVSTAREDETVGDVLKRLQDPEARFDTVDYTYVLDMEGKLKGVVSIKELLNARNSDHLAGLMKTRLAAVHPSTDQERVALLAIKHNIKAVPVVDKTHKFLGVVPSDVILNILHWEHVEDMLRMSGIHGKGIHLRNILKASFFKISRVRIPSLLIGLLGGLLTTSIVSFFHASLEQELLLAFFIPVIVYLSAAVGQQSQTILIRTLATEVVKIGPYILRELFAGLFIGTIIGALMFAIVYLWFRSFAVAATIGISLLLTVTVAVAVAVSMTWLLFKMKKDPAIGGGPFATVIQDILSLVIYFSVATIILI